MLHTPLFSRRFGDSQSISALLDGVDAFLRDLDQSAQTAYKPSDEAHQTDTSYIYTLVLPGFKRDQVTVEVQAQDIVLDRLQHALVVTAIGTHVDRKVSRVITLPLDADSTKVEAKLEDGILTVTVAKIAKPTPPAPRKVTVS